jgi:hypothetical protein
MEVEYPPERCYASTRLHSARTHNLNNQPGEKLKNCNFRIVSSPVGKEEAGFHTNTDEATKIKLKFILHEYLAFRVRSRGT